MKDKPRELNETKLAGLIDMESDFKGDLSFKGSFRIDGFFKGKINSADMLIIGERGHVDAEVRVGYAVINGEFRGQIFGEEKVEIHEHGRVFGTIKSPKLVIAEGAYLEAKCQTTEADAPEETEPKAL